MKEREAELGRLKAVVTSAEIRLCETGAELEAVEKVSAYREHL